MADSVDSVQSPLTLSAAEQAASPTRSPAPTMSPELQQRFGPFAAKMRQADLPEIVIQTFRHYYGQLLAGATGYISTAEAGPVQQLHDYEELYGYELIGQEILDRSVVIKLNGGLGTSMGMDGPKSLIQVKDGLTFLDILVRQILYLQKQSRKRVPLLLMNSFNTQAATLQALQAYPQLDSSLPPDILQHRIPKILAADLSPAQWPADPGKEWCPPGHGDLYTTLVTSGVLQRLLQAGYEYAFVSNADNLGATLDTRILGYFAELELPFLMEVAYRTAADSKGGHLAQRSDGQFMLRELAQCPEEEQPQFQDINLYKFFNTNNLWLHLPSLQRILEERDGMLGLPLIRNQKPVDPQDSSSPPVFQLETAMGSAISVMPNAQAIRVPRVRFLPVKKNNDLLLLWSDVYVLMKNYRLVMNPKRIDGPPRLPPLVELDDRYYKLFADMKRRFPAGPPSMIRCSTLRIEGDVRFGHGVVLQGDVELINRGSEPLQIEDRAVLSGRYSYP